MPRFPGVTGTTGYEWLNMFSHVLVDGRGLERLDATHREFAGEPRDFALAKYVGPDGSMTRKLVLLKNGLVDPHNHAPH
jgi:maltooligosyltrehalose synthase